jgi:hypothetical protein
MVFRSKKQYSNKTTRKRKPKPKSTKPKKQTLYSKKYKQQKGGDKQYIVTIAVITHGCIITTEPEQKYNIRLYNSTGNNIDICVGNVLERSNHHDELKQFFRKDRPTPDPKNTNEIVQLIPHPFDVMPYDKIIGPDNPELFDATIDNLSSIILSDTPVGVWLISVHDINHKLVFPNTEQKDTHYNLLKIHFLNHLMFNFNKKKYFDEHNYITKTLESKNIFPPDKDNNGIRNFDNWNVTLNTEKTHIKFIRLSYLFDWLKYIFGDNVNLNVYDYSCTINCNVDEHPIIPPLITDIEMGKPPFINTIGGTKPKKKKKKKKTI